MSELNCGRYFLTNRCYFLCKKIMMAKWYHVEQKGGLS